MLKLTKKYPSLIGFCWSQVFFSAPGQTFFIALFVAPMFLDLGKSATSFAGIYSAATLVAALFLNLAGRAIDRFPLKWIVTANALLFALGCFILSVSQSLFHLFIAFFFLRYIGQGVFLLTGVTTIGKAFKKNRGKALSLLTLGFPVSEMIFPKIGLALLLFLGWRGSYLLIGIFFIVVVLPLQLYALSKTPYKEGAFLQDELDDTTETQVTATANDKTLKEALREPTLYILIGASCIPPLLMTGLFFHQTTLYQVHGWPLSTVVMALFVYAICKAIFSILIGPILDKRGAIIPFCMVIAFLGIGATLSSFGGPYWINYINYGLMGAGLGMSLPVLNVIWPTLYGTTHLGSIRGFISTFRNGLTAFGPLPLAMAMDAGFSLEKLLLYTGIGVILMSVIPFLLSLVDSRLR